MAAPEQKIQIFSLGLPKKGTSAERRRYRVKWAVDGRHKTRSVKTREQADRFRSELVQAMRDGARFDADTGEPVRWQRTEETWWSWSREWYGLKWPGWAGKSRKSGAEPLVAITPHLLRPRAPLPNFELTPWLWEYGYCSQATRAETGGSEQGWLDRWSLPLTDIEPATLERALTAATTRQDGRPMAPTVIRKRRDLIKAVFTAAVRRDLIDRSPMDRVVWRVPSRSVEIDAKTVPSIADVFEAVEIASARRGHGSHYAALFLLVGLAGLRPSEAARLTGADLDLPDVGWGTARAVGATTSPGSRYTNDGQVREDKSLKHRDLSASRTVPLAPKVVAGLRQHIERWSVGGGRLFLNGHGRPVTADNWGPAWQRVRAELWAPDHPLSNTTVYDLRHTAATAMLQAGVAPAEVARRLGHSVEMLMRVYAGVFQDETERSNARLDRFFENVASGP